MQNMQIRTCARTHARTDTNKHIYPLPPDAHTSRVCHSQGDAITVFLIPLTVIVGQHVAGCVIRVVRVLALETAHTTHTVKKRFCFHVLLGHASLESVQPSNVLRKPHKEMKQQWQKTRVSRTVLADRFGSGSKDSYATHAQTRMSVNIHTCTPADSHTGVARGAAYAPPF